MNNPSAHAAKKDSFPAALVSTEAPWIYLVSLDSESSLAPTLPLLQLRSSPPLRGLRATPSSLVPRLLTCLFLIVAVSVRDLSS